MVRATKDLEKIALVRPGGVVPAASGGVTRDGWLARNGERGHRGTARICPSARCRRPHVTSKRHSRLIAKCAAFPHHGLRASFLEYLFDGIHLVQDRRRQFAVVFHRLRRFDMRHEGIEPLGLRLAADLVKFPASVRIGKLRSATLACFRIDH